MGEETTTSPSGGATPPTGPATGNQGAGSATQPTPALSPDEATKKLADLEHSNRNALEEVERHRKKLSAYEKAEKEREAATQAAKDAELGEVERTKKQFSDLQAQHNEYTLRMQDRIVRYEIENQAAKLGIIDPEAAAALLPRASLEYDEDGAPTNAEKLLKDLIKNKPYLAPKASEQPASPAQTANLSQPSAPAVPPFNVSGRSSIQAPDQLPQGQPVRLNQITWKR